jgi:hypothetical protein
VLNRRVRIVAVNDSWRLVPWADAVYATDALWWIHHNGVPEFKGQRITASPYAAKLFGIELFAPAGATSGVRAIQLAEYKGANPILLVGFEMHPRDGVHWHQPHGGRLRNPGVAEMRIWCTDMEVHARKFERRGTRVINCTPGSALRCFKFMPLEQALGSRGEDRIDRSRHRVDARWPQE